MADWYKATLLDGIDDPLVAADERSRKNDLVFSSRRSPILSRHGSVASSQPLASNIGLDILKKGGNAADAAIAVAAALAVTEPCSTGLGGDMFCLYFDASSRQVSCINGSGKSPARLTEELVKEIYPNNKSNNNNNSKRSGIIDADCFRDSPHSVTVPGAAQGWQDLLERHGSNTLTLAQLVEPAAILAEEGFPVAPITAHHWAAGMAQIAKWLADDDSTKQGNEIPLTVDGSGRAPQAGDIICNADLARVLRELGDKGAKDGFYCGATGNAIVAVIAKLGGCLERSDLSSHTSTFPEPMAAQYRECKLWQVPPNGQGVAGLIALTGLEELEQRGIIPPLSIADVGTAKSYHVLIEMMRLGFGDARAHVGDADNMRVTAEWLLNRKRIGDRAERLFDQDAATIHGVPDMSSCTVSFQVVDHFGNAVSFVNSNFMGFGTGIVPEKCGFTLQNRGFGFNLNGDDHINAIGPSRRPYHTIIPGILTHADTNELYATLSNMGGNMQPQGHFQLTVNLLAGAMNPQSAIDFPRFCIVDGTHSGLVCLEDSVDEGVVEDLTKRGHNLRANVSGHDRSLFGRAQVVLRDRKSGVLWAGSDGRADGCAVGY